MLADALDQLLAVQRSIPRFEASARRPQLPILDDSQDASSEDREPIQGLAHFKDRVNSEIDFISKFVKRDRAPANEPNTNAPNLVSVWNEVVAAPQPILTVGKTFTVRGTAVKVDVVADDGRQWHRVNTIKNSRLLAEFREQDSYLTDSDDDDGEVLATRHADAPLRNSVIEMCELLLEAARDNIEPSSGTPPVVHLRLTRLDGTLKDDPRIARTIDIVRAMPGLVLEQGELAFESYDASENPAPSTSAMLLQPTHDINLDLSVLVALVSDSTHSPLPSSAKEARSRFRLSRRPHVLANGTSTIAGRQDDPPSETHLNALATQVVQETGRSIIDAIAARVTPDTRFWLTSHARDRCMRIVDRIGGPEEKRRAQALLLDADPAAFWSGSRHASLSESARPPIIPLRILQDGPLPTSDDLPRDFFSQAARTCDHILARTVEAGVDAGADASDTAQKTGIGKLTVHTVQSLAAGARARMTTLTANKTSVRGFLREMRVAGHVPTSVRADADTCDAAVWIIDPRSLSEGMRADVDV
ncbi:hypothetical protein EXIGLDRAFT_830802 [Exidia glandulosa HHB12029]|uniref:DUF1308 domain-containing protein n=1 Tax=Exidia glandulosa HHB12029 TaxID=1314781 RepID=A0A165N945_EXIGL|nr:hypothetical protein EXIGLDRAFT_830802 [Exidia glandulosa HHB12029]